MRHRFNPRKRVNDYQRYSMLTVLPLRSMSCTLGNSSSLQAAGDDHSCRYYNSLSAKKDILKNFCVSEGDKCYDENMSWPKNYKNFESDSGNEESRMSEVKVVRRPNFSECRIFRSVDSTHDMIIVKWHLLNFSKPEFVRIFTECSEVLRSVDWTHGMIVVKWHLFIWHEGKLCALTNAPPVQSTQTDQWLSTLFHANYSAPQV